MPMPHLSESHRGEPTVTRPGPPQIRTCGTTASGSSVHGLAARGGHCPSTPPLPLGRQVSVTPPATQVSTWATSKQSLSRTRWRHRHVRYLLKLRGDGG